MKPTIPDTGTVIKLEGEKAGIRMKNEGSCRKCGAAAIGLCKGGFMQVLTVNNSKRARVGNFVKIGLVQGVQFKGYLLAYVIPATGLVFGALGGYFFGSFTGFPSLDGIGAFLSLIVMTFFSLRRLKRLDSSSSIEIVNVLSIPGIPGPRERMKKRSPITTFHTTRIESRGLLNSNFVLPTPAHRPLMLTS